MTEEPTCELRFVKRELKASEVYNGRGFKYVLQQKWKKWWPGDDPEVILPREKEWRDVPMVEEE